MKLKETTLIATMFLCGHAAVSLAGGDYDSLSGLPVVPNSFKTADPVQSYKYCGKNAQANAYYYSGSTDSDGSAEDLVTLAVAWYRKAMPDAIAYTKTPGVFVKPDGTAAVILAGAVISFIRFSPGLSPAEIKGLGSFPAARECQVS